MTRKNFFDPFRVVLSFLFASGLISGCNTTELAPVSPAKELVFYDWEGDIRPTIFDAFAEEFGVQVKDAVYESQEVTITNIRGGEVCDVVV